MKINYSVVNSTLIIMLILLMELGCSDKSSKGITEPEVNQDNEIILRDSSPHFNYFSTLSDVSVIDTIKIILESNFERLSTLFNEEITDTIKVTIYPDFESLHSAVTWNGDPPVTLVGQAIDKYEMKIISPLKSEPINSYSEILLVTVHEFTHVFTFQVHSSREAIPLWLFEGFASYEANMLPSSGIIAQRIANNNLPDLISLRDHDYFLNNHGYHFCYTIIEYIVHEFGYQSLVEFIKFPNRYEQSFGVGMTEELLNLGWHEFLLNNY